MTENDMTQFSEMMLGISEVYSKELSKFGLDIWWNDLKDYPIQSVLMAFTAHRKDPKQGQFFPKPADIVRHIDGLPDEKATAAWSKVYLAMKQHGAWRSVCFDDADIHSAIETMGGWPALCRIDNDTLPFKQKEFEKLYLSAKKNEVKTEATYLIGVIDAHNQSVGGQLEKPAFIGDENKCKQIMNKQPVDKVQSLAHKYEPKRIGS